MPDKLFPAFIGEVPGLDISDGLTRLGGDWDLYLDVLKDYCDLYRDFLPEIKDLIAKKKLKTTRRKAHALKGAAGNVSAHKLISAARRLEIACADQDAREALNLMPEIEASLSEIFSSYKTISANLASPKN